MSEETSIDELTSSLDASFNVSKQFNDPSKPHPHYSLYKNRGELGGKQEKRRQTILQEQKKRRDNALAIARDLANGITEQDESFEEDEEAMEVVERYKVRKRFKNQLMQSEWLVDVPLDFAEKYLMVPVPEGRRSFIVAGYGTTSHYSRSGYFINSFPSLLPGGCRKTRGKDSITFLDCIFIQHEQAYYVLDVMIWNNHSLYNCDTECRQFMLKSHLEECANLGQKSRINPYVFKHLPSFSCDQEELGKNLNARLSFFPNQLDGLLFYNKEVHYLPGTTPLVGWLKGYMVPELLGVKVSDELMAQRPNSYASMRNYIKEYDDEHRSKKKSSENMDESEQVVN